MRLAEPIRRTLGGAREPGLPWVDVIAASSVIDTLADIVAGMRLAHPIRVGVDGRSAAGKTTLADAFADAVRTRRRRDVVRASLDDFHRPGHKYRSERGEWTPRSYYDEAYDYLAFRDLLLRPLGPEGRRRCRAAIWDSFRDLQMDAKWIEVTERAILVVDGAFLCRPELGDEWDYVIWLDVDPETMIARARARDVAWVGSEEVVVERYRQRVIPSHLLYETLVRPVDRADAVVDTRDVHAPRLVRLGAMVSV